MATNLGGITMFDLSKILNFQKLLHLSHFDGGGGGGGGGGWSGS